MWFLRKHRNSLSLLPAIAVIALLSGCGFQPLYKSGGTGDQAALATIDVVTIKDRIGQQLRNMLNAALAPRGRASVTDYRLTVTLTESKSRLAILKDETATRANLTIRAKFKLDALKNPKLRPFLGRALSTNSYNILTSDFATLSAERDARNRALRTLSEEIRLRVAAAIGNPKTFPNVSPAAVTP